MLRALLALALAACVAGMTSTEQSFVVIGEAAIEGSLQQNPALEMPTILMEVSASSTARGIERDILNPRIARQNELIAANHALLADMELLSMQLGAPVLSELAAEQSAQMASSLQAAFKPRSARSNVRFLSDAERALPTALLEAAPTQINRKISPIEVDNLAMVELGVQLASASAPAAAAAAAPAKRGPKHDYAFLDDPKSGGEPSSLQNLQGLDIYVVNVNSPLAANDHEIRPVAPPRPMSAGAREKARKAELMRAQLVHDVPQPKARVAPKTKINTLSAYESTLVPSAPLRKLSKLAERPLAEPIVGGHGAMQLQGVVAATPAAAEQARFAQRGLDSEFESHSLVQKDAAAANNAAAKAMPGTSAHDLPHFPADPSAAPIQARVYNTGSSFDNRDGPPVLLDDLLPVKAALVEDLEPYVQPVGQPNGW